MARRVVAGTAAVAVLVLGGCSGSDGTARARPFSVGEVPDGYRLVSAGRGTQSQIWGADCCGTDEPFTVLNHDDGSRMVVSITGFNDYEGKLDQASASFPGSASDRSEHFEVSGRPAIFAPATSFKWADLVVERGDDLAVRVTGPHATKDALIDMEQRTQPQAEHDRAPRIPSPPSGWHVVGSVNADAVVTWTWLRVAGGQVPGPASAFAAGWRSGDDVLVVVTLPGDALDLDALASPLPPLHGQEVTTRAIKVGGRRAVAVNMCACQYSSPYVARVVVARGARGQIVAVVAGGKHVPTEDVLASLAASVRPSGSAAWTKFVHQATQST